MNHSCCLRSASFSALYDRAVQLVWANGDFEWLDEKQLLNRDVEEFTLNDALHTAQRLSVVSLRINCCASQNLRIAQMVNCTATARAANRDLQSFFHVSATGLPQSTQEELEHPVNNHKYCGYTCNEMYLIS